MAEFFEQIKSIVPWLTPLEASMALNEFEVALFNKYPEYLELPEAAQNAIILKEFKESHYARRH